MADSLTAPKVLQLSGPAGTFGSAPVKCLRVHVGAAAGTEVEVDATGTYQIASIPAGCLVLDVLARVITAFSATVTITLGDGTAAAGFLDSTELAPTTADTDGLYKKASLQANTFSPGKKYLAADTIDAVIGVATPAAGLLEVLIFYVDGALGTT